MNTRKRGGYSTTTMDMDTSQTQNANSRIPGGKRERRVGQCGTVYEYSMKGIGDGGGSKEER